MLVGGPGWRTGLAGDSLSQCDSKIKRQIDKAVNLSSKQSTTAGINCLWRGEGGGGVDRIIIIHKQPNILGVPR